MSSGTWDRYELRDFAGADAYGCWDRYLLKWVENDCDLIRMSIDDADALVHQMNIRFHGGSLT